MRESRDTAAAINTAVHPPPAYRSVLEALPLLSFLPWDVRDLVINSFVPASISFGSPIVSEGDQADGFYVLVSGRARVLKKGENGEEVPLNVLHPGDSFGEMALLAQSTRTATVRASSDVEVFRLDRAVFDALVNHHPGIRRSIEIQIKHRRLHNFFRHFTAFANLPLDGVRLMLSDLEPVSVAPGELVICQGDEPGPMYVVEEGRLRVFTEEDGARQYRAYLRKGDFFGEMSVFQGSRRTASVEAVSPCQLLRLAPATFRELIARYPQFKAQIEERIAQYNYKHVARVPLDFAEEILPADIAAHEKVGPRQIDQREGRRAEPSETRFAPFASPEGYFVKTRKRIRRFPHVRQIDETDCGAACLAMVCRYFGRSVSLTRIRQLVHASFDGTSLKGLSRAAEELGLAARSVKASSRNVVQMPLPAIVHWQGNHWVVLYHVDAQKARVVDPALGPRQIPRAEFDRQWSGYAALFDYTEAFERAPEGGSGAGWLWPFFRPYAGLLLKALGLAVVLSALQMVVPIFTQIIVDRVIVERDFALLNILMAAMAGVLFFSIVAMLLQRYLLSFVAVRIDAASLDYLTRKLLALPMSYFNTRRTGDILRRLGGMRQVREFMVQNAISGLTATVQLGIALLLMFVYSPLLGLAFLATAPLYAILMRVSLKWLRPLFQRLEEAFGKYHSYQIDAIKGIETVKAMGAEGAFRELMLNQFHGVADRVFKADLTMMSYHGSVQAVGFLSTLLFLWVGAHQVMNGTLTIGGLVAFSSLVALANAPIGTLLNMWDNVQLATVLLDRLNDVFDQEPEQGTDHSHLLPVRTLDGRVTLRNVGFQYGGLESTKILEGITFEAPPGKLVALVGRSGSGKTTLIKCLAGLLEPNDGTILYDGVDLKTLNYRELRRRVGFVLQENHLFDDSIARNIAFGEDDPDMDAVVWAARVANAHEFIDRFPLGYDTKIGESGLALSGGQRQRIAIARAVYHRPPILIFDEATSSLDTESERLVQDNMAKLLEGRTSFVIAHRLSTVRDADLIVVLEKGKLIEHGTHDDLMKRQGLYFYLCSQQLEV